MLLGLVADVHCNAEGLREAIARMGPIDELLCAGDAVFQHRFSNEVVELLREHDARYVLGNHELTFLGRDGARARAAPSVRPENLEYMARQPLTLDVQVNGRRLIMAHGSPLGTPDTYVYPDSSLLREMASLDADYVILGHTHHAMAIQVGRTLVINPGSAGDARDLGTGLALSFAVLDTSSGELRFESYPDPARKQLEVPDVRRAWPARANLAPIETNGGTAPGSKTLPPWIAETG